MESNTKQAGKIGKDTTCLDSLEILASTEIKTFTNIRIRAIKSTFNSLFKKARNVVDWNGSNLL